MNLVNTILRETASPDLLVSNVLVKRTLKLMRVKIDLPAKILVGTVQEPMLTRVQTDLHVSNTETIEMKVAKKDLTTTTDEVVRASVELRAIAEVTATREFAEAANAVVKAVVVATEATEITAEAKDRIAEMVNLVVTKVTPVPMALIVNLDEMARATNVVVAVAKAIPAVPHVAVSLCTAPSPLSSEL